MIQVFKTDEDYKKWLDGQRLPSGIVVYVSDDETMYFTTNNIKGELKTYKCEKEEPIIYPPLIYSTNAAGSTITVNGQSMTLEQGENIVLDYPTAITSVKATRNTALTYIQIPNTVTSIESLAFNSCPYLASVNIPDTVTSIGDSAFARTSLTSITIPDGVTSIESNAFNGCGSLVSINIPEGITSISGFVFGMCTSLTSISIPNSVTSIGEYSFQVCSSLASITIPENVTSIESNAFEGCTALTDFNFNGTKAQWGAITLGTDWNKDAAFTVVHCTDGDVSLEEPIQPIQPNKLVYSTNAAGSTITVNGETVTLAKGDNITLDYPNEITSVKAKNNTALTYIQIPNTVTSLESHAFNRCEKLVSITLPDTMTSIGQQTFEYCTSLASITLPEGLTEISGYLFNNCTSLTSVTLPEGLTIIYNAAFSYCSKLTSITLPEGLTEIYDYAFQRCTALTDFNYNGTVEQWASITKSYYWKSGAAFTVVHCTDGDVTV